MDQDDQATFKHFESKMREHVCDTSPTDSMFQLRLDDNRDGVLRLCDVGQLTSAPIRGSVNTLVSMKFHVITPRFNNLFVSIFNVDVRLSAAEFFEEFCLFFYKCLIDSCLSVSASQIDLVKLWSWVLQVHLFFQFSPHFRHILTFSNHLDVVDTYG